MNCWIGILFGVNDLVKEKVDETTRDSDPVSEEILPTDSEEESM